jgi:hypothetical protein
VLIGRVDQQGDARLSTEEKLLRSVFGEASHETVDRSLRAPAGCFGRVVETGQRDDRAWVTVGWSEPLAVGDLLDLDGQTAVVAELRPLAGVDLAWAGGAGKVQVCKGELARDVLHARSIGPYDAVTQLPTVGRERFGGQLVDLPLARVLATHAPWVLWELSTLKADHVASRVRCFEDLARAQNPAADAHHAPPPATPSKGGGVFSFFEAPREGAPSDGVLRLSALVRACGFALSLDGSPALDVLDDAAVLHGSRGRVKPGQLFSQPLFGPLRDFECACGQLRSQRNRGVVCEHCGVEVAHSRVRRERSGHLVLPRPLEHPLTGRMVSAVAVIPPHLRPAGSTLDRRYTLLLDSPTSEPFAALLDELGRELELAWAALFCKPVDSSAVAHLTVDSTLGPRTCRVPRAVLEELFRPMLYGLLEQRGVTTTIRSAKRLIERGHDEARRALEQLCARHPVLLAAGDRVVSRIASASPDPAIAVDLATARGLGQHTVQVHLPLSHEAITECLAFPDFPAAAPPTSNGWLSLAIGSALLPAVLRAAKGRRPVTDPLDDVVLRCALGRPPAPREPSVLAAWVEELTRREAADASIGARPSATLPDPSRPLDELVISVRTAQALEQANVLTLGQLCHRTEADLLATPGFDRKMLEQLKSALAEEGLSLGMRGK